MEDKNEPKIFKQRLDFYGQALAAYLLILLFFLVFFGILNEGVLTVKLFSPLIILMFVIIVITLVLFINATVKRKIIIIDSDSITFQNRFFSKKYNFDEILWIRIIRSPSNVVKGKSDARFIRIKIRNKKNTLLVRTASFDKDKELLDCFISISKTVGLLGRR